ncbi:hypothetical protein S83_063892, partial [Arachis hypogaea]
MNLSLAYKQRKPKGYWDNLENLQHEISRFQRSWGMDPSFMPSKKSFERAGRYDIARALEKWGGLHEVSRLLSLKVRQHRSRQDDTLVEKGKRVDNVDDGDLETPSKPCIYQDTHKWLTKLRQLDINWPDYGVNRQLIELLSVCAPSPEKKLNLLKEIVVEHEIEWDLAASETEFFKKHEDLLNGPTQFVGSNVPPPEEKQDEESDTAPDTFNKEQPDLIPIQTYWTSLMCLRYRSSQMQILPQLQLFHLLKLIFVHLATLEISQIHSNSPPPMLSTKIEANVNSLSSSKYEANVDLQDVLATSHAATKTVERATVAARSAASFAQ